MPTASAEVVSEPAPVVSSVAVPMLDAPSRNVTVPVGVPVVELTVAVNVTACPNTVGFLEDVTAVVAPAVFTFKVAAPDVTEPEELVNTARYWLPFCDMLALNVSVVEVAPGTSVNVTPPSVLTCHCTVGAGEPVAAALKDADCPDVTVRFDGDDVTARFGQEEVEVEVEVGVPLVAFVTAKSLGRAVTTIAVVAVQP